MLEVKKCVVSLEAEEVMELERILTDGDETAALKFLRRCVYERILHSQQGKLKSHLDTANTVGAFIQSSAQSKG